MLYIAYDLSLSLVKLIEFTLEVGLVIIEHSFKEILVEITSLEGSFLRCNTRRGANEYRRRCEKIIRLPNTQSSSGDSGENIFGASKQFGSDLADGRSDFQETCGIDGRANVNACRAIFLSPEDKVILVKVTGEEVLIAFQASARVGLSSSRGTGGLVSAKE